MIGWFFEGGLVMLPVLVVGGMSIAAGAAHAAGLDRAGPAARTLRAATFCLAAAGVAMDLRAVAEAAAGADAGAMGPIALEGLGEALTPLMLAGLMTAVGALFSAAGDLRIRRQGG